MLSEISLSKLPRKTILAITFLVAGYITIQLIADITVAKFTEVFGVTIAAGSLLYAVTFTWRDFMHKRLGRGWARAAIFAAAFMNIGMAMWFQITIWLPQAGFYTDESQAAYAAVLGLVPRVVIASIITEVCAELIDTEVYHWAQPRFKGKWQGMRVILSNGVSAPLDGILFAVLAFAGTVSVDALISIIVGSVILKLVIGYLVMPVTYLIPDKEMTIEIS